MRDASGWITAIATLVIAITAIFSSYYYYRLLKISLAKDKPLVRAYIKKTVNPTLSPTLYVKNEEGGIASNVTITISGREFVFDILRVNESENIPVDVTDGLRIDSLTFEDIHGTIHETKTIDGKVPLRTITKDFGMH